MKGEGGGKILAVNFHSNNFDNRKVIKIILIK